MSEELSGLTYSDKRDLGGLKPAKNIAPFSLNALQVKASSLAHQFQLQENTRMKNAKATNIHI